MKRAAGNALSLDATSVCSLVDQRNRGVMCLGFRQLLPLCNTAETIRLARSIFNDALAPTLLDNGK
jgi:hypothetical protein